MLAEKQQTLWRKYKQWIKKVFPGKPQTVIERWDFIMVFQDRYEDQIRIYFEKYQKVDEENPSYKFTIVSNKDEKQTLVLISIDQRYVYEQAEALKILKRKKKQSYGFDLKSINRQIYLTEESKEMPLCNYLKWIRARLSPQNRKIYIQQQYSVFNKTKVEKYLPNHDRYDQQDTALFTPEEQLRTKYNYLLTYCIEQKGPTKHHNTQIYPLADVMRHAGFKQLIPIHKDSKYGRIVLGNMKEYLGANSQSYFDFVGFLQRWLVFPALIGVLTSLYNQVFQFTADDSPADFFYAFIIMIWSVVFVTQWEHREKWTAACEKTGYSDQWSEFQNLVDRQGSRVRESRVSGQRQQYVPLLQKIWRHFLSISVCSSVLLATLYFMVLSLNARGFVDQNHKFLYFQSISDWARPGGIFDSSTSWAQIPNLVHVLVTNVFDEQIYRPLTKRFTKYEQHFSNHTYENSIIIKFFIYEFIITFADLFYIAFVRMDIVGLREQLLSLFFIDIVRRLIAQLVIPKLASIKRSYSMQPSDPHSERQQLQSQARLEVNKDDYQTFDDYLQIVTNFGYLVMISSCFPLAPLLILIAHSIETVQDKYKMMHIFRRKLPSKYVGMGFWNNIVLFLCFFAIITNILLFAFSSHQIVTLFPKLYESGKDILLGNKEIIDVVTSAANSVIDSVGKTDIMDVVTNAANSVMESVVNATTVAGELAFNQTAQQILADLPFVQSPFQTYCQTTPIVTQFLPPAQQHEVEFVSILFIIEHIFLISFLCLRSFLSKQNCEADVLLDRRTKKREIKKYFKHRAVLGQFLRDSVVNSLIQCNRQGIQIRESEPADIFSSLFTSHSSFSASLQSAASESDLKTD